VTPKLQRPKLQFSLAALLLLVTAAAISSCIYVRTVGRPASTMVEGFVTLNGQPLGSGSVTLQRIGDSKTHTSRISNGQFAFPEKMKMQPGRYNVTVNSPPNAVRPAPAAYSGQSVLSMEVQRGKNYINIDLSSN
jgi:hypothetical protein